jgi:hypothetical protein
VKWIDLDVMRNSDIVEPHMHNHKIETTFYVIEQIVNEGRTLIDLGRELGVSADRIKQRRDHGLRMVRSFVYDADDPTGLFHQALVVVWRMQHDDYEWFTDLRDDWPAYDDNEAVEAALKILGIKEGVWLRLAWALGPYSRKLLRLWDEKPTRGYLMPVRDRFAATEQSWTPEAQWHEFRMMRGDIELG